MFVHAAYGVAGYKRKDAVSPDSQRPEDGLFTGEHVVRDVVCCSKLTLEISRFCPETRIKVRSWIARVIF